MEQYPDPPGTKFYTAWCGDREKHAIKHGIDNVIDDSGAYIEIGSFEGKSTVFIANQIYPKKLISIDPWSAGSPGEIVHFDSRNIYDIFKANIAAGTQGNVEVNKMPWEVYFEKNSPGISFLYLDGPHSYENVYESLEILVPLVLPGGVLIGDDYDDHEVKRAVDDFFGDDMTSPGANEVKRTFYYRKEAA